MYGIYDFETKEEVKRRKKMDFEKLPIDCLDQVIESGKTREDRVFDGIVGFAQKHLSQKPEKEKRISLSGKLEIQIPDHPERKVVVEFKSASSAEIDMFQKEIESPLHGMCLGDMSLINCVGENSLIYLDEVEASVSITDTSICHAE